MTHVPAFPVLPAQGAPMMILPSLTAEANGLIIQQTSPDLAPKIPAGAFLLVDRGRHDLGRGGYFLVDLDEHPDVWFVTTVDGAGKSKLRYSSDGADQTVWPAADLAKRAIGRVIGQVTASKL